MKAVETATNIVGQGTETFSLWKWILAVVVCLAGFARAVDFEVFNIQHSVVFESFDGYTLDWWLKEDPTNGRKWGSGNVMQIDLNDQDLQSAADALGRAILRLGGTLSDAVIYTVGNPAECEENVQPTCATTPQAYRLESVTCNENALTEEECIASGEGENFPCCWQASTPNARQTRCYYARPPICFSLQRYLELVNFTNAENWDISLHLSGYSHNGNPESRGNLTNIRLFLQELALREYRVFSFHYTNEMNLGPQLNPDVLASEFLEIRGYINEFWPDPEQRPLLFGPDVHSTYLAYHEAFLDAGGVDAIDAISFHEYIFGNKDAADIVDKMTDPAVLDTITTHVRDLKTTIDRFLPDAPLIASEVGPCFGGGKDNVSDTYRNVFWYLESLGAYAYEGVKAVTRQTITGGAYEMIPRNAFDLPNPDYYISYLFSLLMGEATLQKTTIADVDLRAYAQCSDDRTLVVAFANLVGQSKTVTVIYDGDSLNGNLRLDYAIRPQGLNLSTQVVQFRVDTNPDDWDQVTDVSVIQPVTVFNSQDIVIPPYGVYFAEYPNIRPTACITETQSFTESRSSSRRSRSRSRSRSASRRSRSLSRSLSLSQSQTETKTPPPVVEDDSDDDSSFEWWYVALPIAVVAAAAGFFYYRRSSRSYGAI